MLLTSDNVRTQEFTLARKGYDEGEVDVFLDEVVAALDDRDRELDALRDRLARGDGEDGPGSGRPSGAEAAAALLALAQRTADQLVAAAREQADDAVVQARSDAAGIADSARDEAARLLEDASVRRDEALRTQQRSSETQAALRATAEEARQQIDTYLCDLLLKVRQPLPPEGPQLRALPA